MGASKIGGSLIFPSPAVNPPPILLYRTLNAELVEVILLGEFCQIIELTTVPIAPPEKPKPPESVLLFSTIVQFAFYSVFSFKLDNC